MCLPLKTACVQPLGRDKEGAPGVAWFSNRHAPVNPLQQHDFSFVETAALKLCCE